jgi:acyl carrier protein
VLTEAELFEHVKTSIATALGTRPSELTPDTRLFEELGVDSVDLLDVSYEIERLTGCELELAGLFRAQDGGTPRPGRELTLRHLVELLQARMAAGGAGGAGGPAA